jgi:Na+-transporting NADH:ubiquinone oxidoreductase subunit F
MLELPAQEKFNFEAGDYIMLEIPPYRLAFCDFDIELPYREEWERLNLLELESAVAEPTTRLYSLANSPQDDDKLTIVVRIATPPPDAPLGTPPGRASSYIFGLKPGDTVTLSGPYGDFHASDSDKEMILIGGGAGVAPLRSIILDQLARSIRRKVSFWYGSRDLSDLCYRKEFEAAAAAHANFQYRVALSQPRSDEAWNGSTGFIHNVVYDEYLREHPAPESAEYFLCGPPLMSAAVLHMLEEIGVDAENVHFDDFGA